MSKKKKVLYKLIWDDCGLTTERHDIHSKDEEVINLMFFQVTGTIKYENVLRVEREKDNNKFFIFCFHKDLNEAKEKLKSEVSTFCSKKIKYWDNMLIHLENSVIDGRI